MRFFYLSILCLFSYASLFAQIELAPLGSNPVLQAHQAKNGKTIPSETIQSKITNTDCAVLDSTFFGAGTTLFVVSGENQLICVDDFFFDNLDTVICKNCDDLQFGSVITGPDEFCFTYTANTGLTLEIGDEIILEVCDEYGCEDLVFTIVVRRANQSITEPMTNIFVESKDTICLDNITLPGQERTFSLLGCHEEAYGFVRLVDNCFRFNAYRFQEMDEVCVEVCDEYCVCDTYTFPINIIGPTLNLPFFDDFSNAGPYPDADLWLEDKVYVNSHLAYQPPSVGTATFDGLDAGGLPYGDGFGAADVLTSGYIDLSNLISSDVNLSYYIQPKGVSNFFPALSDSLTLEFRDDVGDWILIKTLDGLPGSTPPLEPILFDDFQVHKVIDSSFFHDRFQFRFTSYNERKGLESLWHLDYVSLIANGAVDGTFTDITFTEIPSSILKTYRHMPWHQFKADTTKELSSVVDISLYNHGEIVSAAEPASLLVLETSTNKEIISDPTLLINDANTLQRNISPQMLTEYSNSMKFSPIATAFDDDQKDLTFELSYAMIGGSDQKTNDFPAVGRNDTVRTETHFSNYFAYDDGSAEGLITGNQNNIQIATEFHANVEDELVAVQFNFPYTENSISADFVIKVWLDSLGKSDSPIYTSPTLSPIFANDFFDTLNAFTTYKLFSETLEEVKVPIPAGKFFVGIQQVSTSGRIGVGFDQNSQDMTHQFFRAPGSTQEWKKIIIPGAMMIRPVVGGESPSTTATEDLAKANPSLQVKVFPNPSQGLLHLPVNQENTSDLEMMIVNSMGQVMLLQNWQAQLDLAAWTDGLYFLQIRDKKTGAEVKEKFLILR